MQESQQATRPVRFGIKRETQAPDPSPENEKKREEKQNVRVDPLAAERTALADARASLEQEKQELDAARAELDEERTALAESAASLVAARKSALEENIDELAEIALAVVGAIITDAFDEAPERAAALARAALEADKTAALRVGPALHIALLESGEATSATLDATLSPYGCVAESASRRVIAGLEDRLGEVLRALKEAT